MATSRSPVQTTRSHYRRLTGVLQPFLVAPAGLFCPSCGGAGCLRSHGHYYKYHWAVLILILRVRCRVCRVTHALIPSFSMPQSSHDTGSVETYLKARAAGMTRRQAGAEVLAQGFEIRVLKRLERSFARGVRNWSALFGLRLGPTAGIDAFAARNGIDPEGPVLVTANLRALDRRVNAVFTSRSSILLFVNLRTGERIPHNLASVGSPRAPPDF